MTGRRNNWISRQHGVFAVLPGCFWGGSPENRVYQRLKYKNTDKLSKNICILKKPMVYWMGNMQNNTKMQNNRRKVFV